MVSEIAFEQLGVISGPSKKEIIANFFSEAFSCERHPIIFRTKKGMFSGHFNSLARIDGSGLNFYFEGQFNGQKIHGYYYSKTRNGIIYCAK